MKRVVPCIDCKYIITEYIFYGTAIQLASKASCGALVSKIRYILLLGNVLETTNGCGTQILLALGTATDGYN